MWKLSHLGKRASKNSSSFKILDHHQSFLVCYFQPVSLADLGLKQKCTCTGTRKLQFLAFWTPVDNTLIEFALSFLFCWVSVRMRQKHKFSLKPSVLKSSPEATGKSLNKDSVELSRAQPQFLFHPEKGKSR